VNEEVGQRIVVQSELRYLGGVIPSGAAFQAERGISPIRKSGCREIPWPADENAGLRDDAVVRARNFGLIHFQEKSPKMKPCRQEYHLLNSTLFDHQLTSSSFTNRQEALYVTC
jgi:hypothetical protein